MLNKFLENFDASLHRMPRPEIAVQSQNFCQKYAALRIITLSAKCRSAIFYEM